MKSIKMTFSTRFTRLGFSFMLCCLLANSLTAQSNIQQTFSVNSDGSAAHASAQLDVSATDKGMLVPRMTTAQRTAIVSPANGLLVYDNTNNNFWYYKFGSWYNLSQADRLSDADGDTWIDTEFLNDDDRIRFSVNGYQGINISRNQAGYNTILDVSSGNTNTLVGTYAGDNTTTGERNTVLGYHCLSENITGSRNVAVGWNTLRINNYGNSNVAIGYYALHWNSIRSNLVAVGDSSLMNNITGTANTAIGSKALLSNSSGLQNTALGYQAMTDNTSGEGNTASGYLALSNNTTGDANTGIGLGAVLSNTTGNQNTGLGRSAFFTAAALNNTTAIGYSSGGQTNVSNRIEIGNTSVSWIGGQVNWGTYSDARIKNQVQENVPGLDFIKKLRPVTYHLDIHKQNELTLRGKEDTADYPEKYDIEKKQMTGFIAQEVEAAAKAVGYDFSGVEKGADEVGIYSVKYAEFVVPLVKAVQEQQAEIEVLRMENAALKAQLETEKAANIARLDKITAALTGAGISVEK